MEVLTSTKDPLVLALRRSSSSGGDAVGAQITVDGQRVRAESGRASLAVDIRCTQVRCRVGLHGGADVVALAVQ